MYDRYVYLVEYGFVFVDVYIYQLYTCMMLKAKMTNSITELEYI